MAQCIKLRQNEYKIIWTSWRKYARGVHTHEAIVSRNGAARFCQQFGLNVNTQYWPKESVRATLAVIKSYRRFIREGQADQVMIDPLDEWRIEKLTKQQAQEKLTWLVHVAIGRRGGIPD